MTPRVLLIRAAGTNCDGETARAFELAGASVDLLHINRVAETPGLLEGYHIMAIPGGFSFGDDIAAGRIFALHLARRLGDAMRKFVEDGKPIAGICNGFQVLIQTGLLGGGDADDLPRCSLAGNAGGRFIDQWVTLDARKSPCVWTRGIDSIELPIAHGEGRLAVADDADAHRLLAGHRVPLVYASGSNVNGSVGDIASLTDASGLVFGLMPHPERYVTSTQHYAWTRRPKGEDGAGMAIFANAVGHAKDLLTVR